jgi:hypothetical protein
MRRFSFFAFAVVLLITAGCKKDATFSEPIGEHASITWANVVPDTGQLDIRVVDIPSNAALFDAPFRTGLIYPQGIEAGPRRIKVFLSSTDPDTAKIFLIDTTFDFAADERYSFYVAGFTRSGRTPPLQAVITSAQPPALSGSQFAIRVINLAPSLAGVTLPDTTVAIDALLRPISAVSPGTPDITSVPYLGVSPYVVLDTGRYQLALASAGSGAASFVAAPVLPGARGTVDDNGNPTADPIGGSIVGGTALTAVILPRSVVGSKAPQGGRPTLRTADTSVAEAARRVTLNGDIVTVQSGSVDVLVNRGAGRADSTLPPPAGTGSRGATAAARGDVVVVTGATQPEYNGWHAVLATADSLSCNPTGPSDTATRCSAANATATTRFRFRYRITGTPASPGTGNIQYRVYAPLSTGDFTLPYIMFMVDQRPPNTTP